MRKNTIKGLRETQYQHVRKDPILEQVTTLIMEDPRSFPQLAADCGPVGMAPATLRNWCYGKTRRPQNLTVEWTLAALGYERVVRKVRRMRVVA